MKKVRFFLAIAVVVALMTACNQNVENAKSIAQLTENDVPISRIDPTDTNSRPFSTPMPRKSTFANPPKAGLFPPCPTSTSAIPTS